MHDIVLSALPFMWDSMRYASMMLFTRFPSERHSRAGEWVLALMTLQCCDITLSRALAVVSGRRV